MTPPFLSIVGIGEDGPSGLSVTASALLAQASLVIGGARHLALAESLITADRITWPNPIADAVPLLHSRKVAPVVALASGDPFCFGVGPMLAAAFPGQWHCLPQPSCLSLACAKLGWALQDCETLSFCGRPLARLASVVQPGMRLLALSEDANTPGRAAALLCRLGFGASEIIVLEALGGPNERVRSVRADCFDLADLHPLNLMAITLTSPLNAIPLCQGLDDGLFQHDGQITKREIRAATLSALAPFRGGVLWDIGAGSGSISIEWMLRHPTNRAFAVERHTGRCATIAGNAQRLGVPELAVVTGTAPGALRDLPPPDAVFIGGGGTAPGVVELAWKSLRSGGRMVANAVTIETEGVLFDAHRSHGGSLTRLGVERLETIGGLHGFRPAMTVTQWAATRP